MTEPLGEPVVSLEALRKHRHLPAAAALMSVLLYTALVTSHIVSQATHRALPAQDADIQTVVAGDAGCHDLPSSAGNGHHPSGGYPVSPPKKCPFCAGYAALHITLVGGSVTVLPVEIVAQRVAGFGAAQPICSANLPSWHARAPPTLS